jgi:outer membrane protein with beta-barrel domain
MHTKLVLALSCMFALVTVSAQAQQFDMTFGASTVIAPSSSSATGNFTPQTIGGGTYLGFSGDYLFWHNIGLNGEINWRASQNLYGGNQPFRPLFIDFNGMWVPHLSERVQPEFKAGLGVASVRFYTPTFTCDFFSGSCTNYDTRNHFMGDLGAAVRLYVHGHVFVRPEVQLYLIHNNVEFSSGHAERVGVSIGYTFGSQY